MPNLSRPDAPSKSRQSRSEIRGQHQVAPLIELVILKPGPFAVDVAALNVAAHHEHAVRVSVIGAAVAVFMCGAAEFAHGHKNNVCMRSPMS